MTITMLTGGACLVRFSCGDTTRVAAAEQIPAACPTCGRIPPPLQVSGGIASLPVQGVC